MTAISTMSDMASRDTTDALDPRKSMPDYRLEIYNMLQRLDTQQEEIEHRLAACSKMPRKQTAPMVDEEDGFVVVEDINKTTRRKSLLSQLQQIWRTREALRQRARHLNIRIDSLQHGRHATLMHLDDEDATSLHADEEL